MRSGSFLPGSKRSTNLTPMATHARGNWKECIDCSTPGRVGDGLSNRGLCESCAIDRMMKSAVQLQAGEGPYYDQWRKSMKHAALRMVEAFSD